MKLLVDIGNSSIKIKKVTANGFEFMLHEPINDLTQIEAKLNQIDLTGIDLVVMSSVVPNLAVLVKTFFETKQVKVISVFDLLAKLIGNVDSLIAAGIGEDFVAEILSVAPTNPNVVVINLGTATTFLVLKNGLVAGLSIAPGIKTSLETLINSAALLKDDEFKPTTLIVGNTTNEAISIGAINGHWFMIEKQLEKITSLFDQIPKIIFTGGNAKLIMSFIDQADYEYNEDLIFQGLNLELN